MRTFLFVALLTVLPLSIQATGQVIDFRDVPGFDGSDPPGLPTPTALFERHVEATGGKAAHEHIRTRRIVGVLRQNGQPTDVTLHRSAPNNQHVVLGRGTRFVTNSTESWTYEGEIVVASSGDQRSQEIRRAAFNVYLDWERLYMVARTTGVETVGDRRAFVVLLTAEDCHKVRYFFDEATGLHVRTEEEIAYAGDTIRAEATLSEYRAFDGVGVPMRIERILLYRGNRIVQEYEFTSVECNVAIDESMFETPRELQADQPIA